MEKLLKKTTKKKKKQQQQQQSSLRADNNKLMSLPEDVLMKILVTLPVKSLLCLRCVSKSLCYFLKNPNFINMHMKHEHECILIKRDSFGGRKLLSFDSYGISTQLEVPYFSDKCLIKVSWPCNGLLLCVSYYPISTIVLCNPAIKEFKLLPSNPFHVPYRVYPFGLCFDSNKCNYKVVTFKYYDHKAQVYNLTSNSWRQIDHAMPYEYGVCTRTVQGVPFNGALHWVAQRKGIDIILCFDVSIEVFQEMELPHDLVRTPPRIVKIPTILNDTLALFAFNTCEPKFIAIWVMKEYGSWTKQVCIDDIFNTDRSWYPRLLWKNEAVFIEVDRLKLKSCDLDTHVMTDTGIVNHGTHGSYGVVVYNESLVSIY